MQILYDIAEHENIKFTYFRKLAGGDINEVFLVKTSTEKWVVKLNDSKLCPNFFKEEACGLTALAATNTFTIPKVISYGELNNHAYLILEYMTTGVATNAFWEDFGIQLAALHQHTNAYFGWETHNFIGSLPQYNLTCSSSATFFISQRLAPQIELALQNGYAFKKISNFYTYVEIIIPNQEKPALIHGDLWSGNYLVSIHQQPVLIDPAVCFASREMDLAMMQLFGGFPKISFDVYQHHFPLLPNWESRLEIYQLYYLLVHLNLFGDAYFESVQKIINKYQ